MVDKQYGLSAKEIMILKEEAATRAANRNYFLKQTHSPFIQATSNGGYLFDPAIQRYQSMHVSHLEHFKPTPKTSWLGFVMIVGVMGSFTYFLKRERDDKLHKLRTGQVSYRDRQFKFT